MITLKMQLWVKVSRLHPNFNMKTKPHFHCKWKWCKDYYIVIHHAQYSFVVCKLLIALSKTFPVSRGYPVKRNQSIFIIDNQLDLSCGIVSDYSLQTLNSTWCQDPINYSTQFSLHLDNISYNFKNLLLLQNIVF